MTLGRTDKGAIKIKTDKEGGGLRAVNCACCSPCGCNTAISGDLLKTMRNATTGTCNGASPSYWNAQGGGFFAYWLIFVSGQGFVFYTANFSELVNCFNLGGDNALNIIASGKSEGCCALNPSFPATCADVIYTINGDAFDAHTENFGFGADVTPPTFVFS